MFKNNDNYTHFAVNKKTNLIVNGWDYSGYDPSELRQFKKDYFIADLMDYELNPKDYKILTYNGCKKQGIDPDDNCQWSNDGITPSCSRNESRKITGKQLQEIITKSVYKILKESFFDFNQMPEANDNDSEESDSYENSQKRQRVLSKLKSDKRDLAQYAYALDPNGDEDSVRSYFYKKLNHEENDNGVPYEFSNDEINKLYSMLNDDGQ